MAFNEQLFFQGENRTFDNQFSRKFNTSPLFSFSNSDVVVVGGTFLIDFESEKPRTGKYLPFNIVRVVNNSSNEVTMFPNQKREDGIPIASGTTQTFTQDTIRFVRSLKFENTGTTTITANQIKINVQKDRLNEDSEIKRIRQKEAGQNTAVF